MRLLGALALIAAFAFGSAAFGSMLAADCVFVGIVEECIFTGAVFSLISKYYAANKQFFAADEQTFAEQTYAASVQSAPKAESIAKSAAQEKPQEATQKTSSQKSQNAIQKVTQQEAYKTSQQARAEIKPAAITALLFALCHLAMPWKLPIAFAFSLCMIWLYRRSGSIMWTICAHAVFDMLWFGLFVLS